MSLTSLYICIISAAAACLCLLSACSKPKPSEIPGIYSAQRSYGTETLSLRPDGTYLQVFRSGSSTRTNTGKWMFHPEQSFVSLENALVFDDGWGRKETIIETCTWGLDVERDQGVVSLMYG